MSAWRTVRRPSHKRWAVSVSSHSSLVNASRVAVADISSAEFDVIICDIHMPVVNGEQVARMIRSTNNHNQNTPSWSGLRHDGDGLAALC